MRLSELQLKLAATLPQKPDPVILEGKRVYLEPLVINRDCPPLFELSNGSPVQLGHRSMEAYDPYSLIWRYMFNYPPSPTIEEFTHLLTAQVNAPDGLCLCVFDRDSKRAIGVANFMNNAPTHLKVELGGIWYSPIAQGTGANTEATYLMLKHAFHLGYRRVEWKCHALNERSRKAALKIGFKFEGIQENHMIDRGKSRDTAWFRMLDSEWLNSLPFRASRSS